MISMIIFTVAESLQNVDSSCVYDVEKARNFILDRISEEKYSPNFVDRVSKQLEEIKEEYGISIEEHKDNIRNMYN